MPNHISRASRKVHILVPNSAEQCQGPGSYCHVLNAIANDRLVFQKIQRADLEIFQWFYGFMVFLGFPSYSHLFLVSIGFS